MQSSRLPPPPHPASSPSTSIKTSFAFPSHNRLTTQRGRGCPSKKVIADRVKGEQRRPRGAYRPVSLRRPGVCGHVTTAECARRVQRRRRRLQQRSSRRCNGIRAWATDKRERAVDELMPSVRCRDPPPDVSEFLNVQFFASAAAAARTVVCLRDVRPFSAFIDVRCMCWLIRARPLSFPSVIAVSSQASRLRAFFSFKIILFYVRNVRNTNDTNGYFRC